MELSINKKDKIHLIGIGGRHVEKHIQEKHNDRNCECKNENYLESALKYFLLIVLGSLNYHFYKPTLLR